MELLFRGQTINVETCQGRGDHARLAVSAIEKLGQASGNAYEICPECESKILAARFPHEERIDVSVLPPKIRFVRVVEW